MGVCSTSAASDDGRTVFAPSPNGQLKMPRMGNYCLTLVGDSPSSSNVAQGADVAATSSSSEHAVKNIVDADAQSFWASSNDPTAPVDVQFDFGATQQINSIQIDWEHPAQVHKTLGVHVGVVFLCFLSNAWLRPSSCKSPPAANGQVYTQLLATICKRRDIWDRASQAPPCGSA